MIFPILAKIPIIMHFVAVIWVLIAITLILLVLIQKGRGGGLGAAIGGGMAQSLLGSKTGDFLTWVTICLCALFLGMAVLMAKFYRPVTPRALPPVQAQTAPEMTPDAQNEDAAAMPEGEMDIPELPQTQMPEPPLEQTQTPADQQNQ